MRNDPVFSRRSSRFSSRRSGHLTPPSRRALQGLALIDCLMAVAVATAAASSAGPSLVRLRSTAQVAQAAAEFETDVQMARSNAVTSNATVRLSFEIEGSNACYVIHTGPAGSCRCMGRAEALCSGDAQSLRQVDFGAKGRVSMAPNVKAMAFDAHKGTVTPSGTVKFQSGGASVHQIVNVMGRVRSCSPGRAVPGYRAC